MIIFTIHGKQPPALSLASQSAIENLIHNTFCPHPLFLDSFRMDNNGEHVNQAQLNLLVDIEFVSEIVFKI